MYVAETLSFIESVEAHQGDLAEALAHYEESLAEARQMDNRLIIAPGLEGLAAVVAAQGEVTWAARLWGAAERLREALGTPLPLLTVRAMSAWSPLHASLWGRRLLPPRGPRVAV